MRLWDVASHTLNGVPLTGHTGTITWIQFSPNGQVLASASFDQTVRLWDVGSRRLIGDPLERHTSGVWGVAFSPTDRILVSGDERGTIVTWSLDHEDVIDQLCAHAGMDLTRDEWTSHIPDLPYQPLCP